MVAPCIFREILVLCEYPGPAMIFISPKNSKNAVIFMVRRILGKLLFDPFEP
jgi:hypothetical protein